MHIDEKVKKNILSRPLLKGKIDIMRTSLNQRVIRTRNNKGF